MNLTINELYEQYEKSITLQSSIIESCKRDLENARRSRKNILAAELHRHLTILNDERLELMANACELRKYIDTVKKSS